jgi:hypothetical protein
MLHAGRIRIDFFLRTMINDINTSLVHNNDQVHSCLRRRHQWNWQGRHWRERRVVFSTFHSNSGRHSLVGLLLKTTGLKVTAIKIDPYMNIDAGTIRPTEHGERVPVGINSLQSSISYQVRCPQ